MRRILGGQFTDPLFTFFTESRQRDVNPSAGMRRPG
jgi:hypothetical protein